MVAKSESKMKSDGPLKHFALAFLLAVVFYAVLYRGCEQRRTKRGPWEVTFTTNSAGFPLMLINQPRLAITNKQIHFPDQQVPATNKLELVEFRQPKPVPFPVPFGKCVFMDTTFLPGTVAFEIFGHQIELMPRVLITDHQEHPWVSDNPITLHPAVTVPVQARSN
jgi:hypothetical protein